MDRHQETSAVSTRDAGSQTPLWHDHCLSLPVSTGTLPHSCVSGRGLRTAPHPIIHP